MPHDDGLICAGAPAIAAFLGARPRQIYAWAKTGRMPAFKVGGVLCADKAALRAWLAERTAAARRPAQAQGAAA